MPIQSFDQLDVWKRAHELVLEVYRVTKVFPAEERFGLVTQMRRAAISIPANIAEGFRRRGLKDKIHFYNIAQGSLEEVRYYYMLARDLVYVAGDSTERQQIDDVARMLPASSDRWKEAIGNQRVDSR